MKNIYLDHSSATYIDNKVLKKMLPYLTENFGNSFSLHSPGRKTKAAIENARKDITKILNVNSNEIIFTGSGTESDNLAIFGIAKAYQNKGKHIIVSKIEHKAVLEAAKKLEKEGFKITYLNVDSGGLVKISELKRALRPDTILVSIMYANNEIGAIQPISEISKIIANFRNQKSLAVNRQSSVAEALPLFHTDACQAINFLPLRIDKLGVDLLTFNGSKIYGPKGIGCLYKQKEIKLEPIIVGGGQENNFRAGTESAALIIGLAQALKLTEKLKEKEGKRLRILRDYFIKNILKSVPYCRLNGDLVKRLPNNINISISGIEGESIVLMMDKYGISVSTGSACSSYDLVSSYVLAAINLSPETAHNSIRLTLGRDTTKNDINYTIGILSGIVKKLRRISSINYES